MNRKREWTVRDIATKEVLYVGAARTPEYMRVFNNATRLGRKISMTSFVTKGDE